MLLCAFSVAVPSQTSGVVVFCTQGLQAALGLHRSHRFRGKVLTVTRFGKSIFQTLKKDSTQAQNSGFLSYDPVKFKCTGKFDIWGSDIGAIGREEGNEEVHGAWDQHVRKYVRCRWRENVSRFQRLLIRLHRNRINGSRGLNAAIKLRSREGSDIGNTGRVG